MDENRYAILIGINDYKTKPLKYSVNDVDLLQKALNQNCNFTNGKIYPIMSDSDNPIEDVYAKFDAAVKEISSQILPGDTVLFYFSGHGHFNEGSYLEFHEKEVSLQEIYEILDRMSPKTQIYIVDACHSGSGVELKSSETEVADYYNERIGKRSDGFHMLCSSKSDQVSIGEPSIKNGLYTWHLVSAINKKELYDQDLLSLSISDIHNFAVKRLLMDFSAQQTPFYFGKSAGYYPFSFLRNDQPVSKCQLSMELTDENSVRNLLDRGDFNMPNQFKRDFSQFLSELVLNLYGHNRSRGVKLIIDNNAIEVHDDSRVSFDPFLAVKTETGKGIIVYNAFLRKYDGLVSTSYIPGDPNVIRLVFDDKVFSMNSSNPCHIQIEDTYIYELNRLNTYDFNKDCKEIFIDISESVFPLSFAPSIFDYLIQHTDTIQMIILKMHKDDMLREDTKAILSHNNKYQRIMVI